MKPVDLGIAESGVGVAPVVVRVDHLFLVFGEHRTDQDLLTACLGSEVDPCRAVGCHRDRTHPLGQLSIEDLDPCRIEVQLSETPAMSLSLLHHGPAALMTGGVDGLARAGGYPGYSVSVASHRGHQSRT